MGAESTRELRAPVECTNILEQPRQVPEDTLLKEFHRLKDAPGIRVTDDGVQKGFADHRHLIGYQSADNKEQLSTLWLKNPDTGKEAPWSIADETGRNDTFNVATGARETAVWGFKHNDGETNLYAEIDSGGTARTEFGSFYNSNHDEIYSFKYNFDSDGNATSCYRGKEVMDFDSELDPQNWQQIWPVKAE